MIARIVTAGDRGQRLDKYIKRTLPETTSSFVYKMLRKKSIVLNGGKADGKEILSEGDVVTFWFSEETFAKFAGTEVSASHTDMADSYRRLSKEFPDIRVLYEQSELAFVCKPAGVLTQKAAENDISLNEWFLGYLIERGELSAEGNWTYTPSVCNRLDRNTGGIVICAKTLLGSRIANAVIRDRSVRKYYRLVATGQLTGDGEIHVWTHKDPRTNRVLVYHHPVPGAAETLTRYRSIRYSEENDMSLIEAELVTGKTHQLRVHFSDMGHPIVGDPKYGGRSCGIQQKIPYQLLWSSRLELPDFTEPELADLCGRTILCEPPELFEELTR